MRSIKEQLIAAEILLRQLERMEIRPVDIPTRISQYFGSFERRQLLRSNRLDTPKPMPQSKWADKTVEQIYTEISELLKLAEKKESNDQRNGS
jgi:hypothetical protein